MQKTLSHEQIEEFYHDDFVESQVKNFLQLLPTRAGNSAELVVDVGGGCGFFAKSLNLLSKQPVRVVDSDPVSIEACRRSGLDARCEDALHPHITGDESIICFNLILHHLVGSSERSTLELQQQALKVWRGRANAVFIDEYIYDSYVGNLSGRLIYVVTSSKLLSAIGRAVSRFVPSLRANTFGVGVRFRSKNEWVDIFESLGFVVDGTVRGAEEFVSVPRRLLLIKSCRRDSFLLLPRAAQTH